MFFLPITYDQPLFRPPAEAYSAILQITLGCSHNNCAFCEMYKSKKFRIKPIEQIEKEAEALADYYSGVRRVFLADGNAMVLSYNKLMQVLQIINSKFGKLQRISAYALPSDILSKTDEELQNLSAAGLKLVYIGIESGDNEILKMVNKGESFDTTAQSIIKAKAAGIETSAMILNGLGGTEYWQQHAINSAKLINLAQPKYLSTLTLSFPTGPANFIREFGGDYKQQTIVQLLQELKLFLENINEGSIIFRSNHVSNNLALAGTLPKDKQSLIDQINQVIKITPEDEMMEDVGML
jgi:radical SAM superfamily enzyme YgiQ (UPF0313 family)